MNEYLNSILKKASNQNIYYQESYHNFSSNDAYLSYVNALKTLVLHNLLEDIGNSKYRITPNGNKIFNEIGVELYLKKSLETERMNEHKRTIEYQKTLIDYELAKKMLKDYPRTRKIALFSILISALLLLKELYMLLKILY